MKMRTKHHQAGMMKLLYGQYTVQSSSKKKKKRISSGVGSMSSYASGDNIPASKEEGNMPLGLMNSTS